MYVLIMYVYRNAPKTLISFSLERTQSLYSWEIILNPKPPKVKGYEVGENFGRTPIDFRVEKEEAKVPYIQTQHKALACRRPRNLETVQLIT